MSQIDVVDASFENMLPWLQAGFTEHLARIKEYFDFFIGVRYGAYSIIVEAY